MPHFVLCIKLLQKEKTTQTKLRVICNLLILMSFGQNLLDEIFFLNRPIIFFCDHVGIRIKIRIGVPLANKVVGWFENRREYKSNENKR